MLYRAPDVADQPSVRLMRWRIFQLPNGDRHLCGTIPQDGHDGRVSSKLMSFDIETQTGITRSGRCYTLVGDSSSDADAEYVLRAWLMINGVDRDSITFVEPQAI